MLGTIASIATLVLFVIYLIGRIVTILSVKRLLKDKFITNVDEKKLDEYAIVDDIYDFNAVGGYNEGEVWGLVVSKEGMRNIRAYRVKEDRNGINRKKDRLLFARDFLNIDEVVAIHVPTGDLYPTLFIEYETIDYMRVEVEWRDNLKNGVFMENAVPKHTWKSFLYFLCR